MFDSRAFWSHVESVTTLTTLIAQNCNIARPEGQKLCKAMSFLSTHHVSIHRWKRDCASIGDTVEHGKSPVEVTSALLYILDAFVPLLDAFCRQLHKRLRRGTNAGVIQQLLTEERKDKLRAFGKALLVICFLILAIDTVV